MQACQKSVFLGFLGGGGRERERDRERGMSKAKILSRKLVDL